MSKKKYKVIVREVLGREIEIEADSIKDAIEESESMYNREKIVLTADDCVSRDIFIEDVETGETINIFNK